MEVNWRDLSSLKKFLQPELKLKSFISPTALTRGSFPMTDSLSIKYMSKDLTLLN